MQLRLLVVILGCGLTSKLHRQLLQQQMLPKIYHSRSNLLEDAVYCIWQFEFTSRMDRKTHAAGQAALHAFSGVARGFQNFISDAERAEVALGRRLPKELETNISLLMNIHASFKLENKGYKSGTCNFIYSRLIRVLTFHLVYRKYYHYFWNS